MERSRTAHFSRLVGFGILIGIAGGVAEIVWIALFGSLAGPAPANVASAVAATVNPALPGVSFAAAPVAYGIVVHLLLAAGLGIALVFAWRALTGFRPQRINEYAFMTVALTIVWAFNFFVLLPLINPDFAALVPYSASLVSKLLFGLAAAAVLQRATADRPALIPVRVRVR